MLEVNRKTTLVTVVAEDGTGLSIMPSINFSDDGDAEMLASYTQLHNPRTMKIYRVKSGATITATVPEKTEGDDTMYIEGSFRKDNYSFDIGDIGSEFPNSISMKCYDNALLTFRSEIM